jgi:hypothetical protein
MASGGQSVLDQEIKYYDENRTDWLSRYPDKYVLVKGRQLIGAFDTITEALAEGARRFGLDNFLVRQVGEGEQGVKIPALTLGLLCDPFSH